MTNLFTTLQGALPRTTSLLFFGWLQYPYNCTFIFLLACPGTFKHIKLFCKWEMLTRSPRSDLNVSWLWFTTQFSMGPTLWPSASVKAYTAPGHHGGSSGENALWRERKNLAGSSKADKAPWHLRTTLAFPLRVSPHLCTVQPNIKTPNPYRCQTHIM